MKVAVITHYFPTALQPWAGHSSYQTLRMLARQCDLHVFYPETVYPRLLTPPASRGPALDRGWSPGDVAVTYLPCPSVPVLARPLNGAISAAYLLPHVRRFAPDIILNYVVYPNGHAAVRIARALKIPVVLTAIGSDLNRMADPLCAALTRRALRRADFVTTVSHDLCQTARRLGADPARSKAKLNGCDTSVFFPADRVQARLVLGVDQGAEVILYVGRLDVRKGLIELIDAMALVHAQRPRARCFIVGEGPDDSLLRDALARHRTVGVDLSGVITLIPACRTVEVARWMAAADLVTLPSYNEGCPNVVLEALSAGRPVVATLVGGIPEIVDDSCGRLIPPRDVAALSAALMETLDRTLDASTISARHSRSWADVSNDLYQILEETLAQRNVPRRKSVA